MQAAAAVAVAVAALLGRPRLVGRCRLGDLARPPSLAMTVDRGKRQIAGRGVTADRGAREARIRRLWIGPLLGVHDGLGKRDAAGIYSGRTRTVAVTSRFPRLC